MQTVNRLGLRVVASTLVLLLVTYGIYRAVRAVWFTSQPSPTSTQQPSVSSRDQTEDSDQDGLSDLLENLYTSNPRQPDSDGDGTLDGAEVAVDRDPTVAGPNDALATTTADKIVVQLSTYTGRYLASLPPNLSQDEILNKARVEAFVNENKGELLPAVDVATVKTTSDSGKEAIAAYLDSISSAHNSALTAVTSTDIEAAFRAYHADPQGSKELQTIYDKLRKNVSTLQAIPVPEEAKELHVRLLAASMALTNNVELLLGETKDFVGGLIGAKNIEELGPVFAQLGEDITALQKKYNIP